MQCSYFVTKPGNNLFPLLFLSTMQSKIFTNRVLQMVFKNSILLELLVKKKCLAVIKCPIIIMKYEMLSLSGISQGLLNVLSESCLIWPRTVHKLIYRQTSTEQLTFLTSDVSERTRFPIFILITKLFTASLNNEILFRKY